MDARDVYIYGLVDPETDEIRYIGKSIRPMERLTNHMNETSKCHRCNWLQSLKGKGLRPRICFFEFIPNGIDWQNREKYWIRVGKDNGWPLTNNTDGGDGVTGLSGDALYRLQTAWVGRKHKPETLLKIGKASKGRIHTEYHKQHMSNIMKGREITWGDTISESNKKLTDSDVENIKEKLSKGAKVKDLAHEYGVHRTTISKVKSGVYGLKYDGKEKKKQLAK